MLFPMKVLTPFETESENDALGRSSNSATARKTGSRLQSQADHFDGLEDNIDDCAEPFDVAGPVQFMESVSSQESVLLSVL